MILYGLNNGDENHSGTRHEGLKIPWPEMAVWVRIPPEAHQLSQSETVQGTCLLNSRYNNDVLEIVTLGPLAQLVRAADSYGVVLRKGLFCVM